MHLPYCLPPRNQLGTQTLGPVTAANGRTFTPHRFTNMAGFPAQFVESDLIPAAKIIRLPRHSKTPEKSFQVQNAIPLTDTKKFMNAAVAPLRRILNGPGSNPIHVNVEQTAEKM